MDTTHTYTDIDRKNNEVKNIYTPSTDTGARTKIHLVYYKSNSNKAFYYALVHSKYGIVHLERGGRFSSSKWNDYIKRLDEISYELQQAKFTKESFLEFFKAFYNNEATPDFVAKFVPDEDKEEAGEEEAQDKEEANEKIYTFVIDDKEVRMTADQIREFVHKTDFVDDKVLFRMNLLLEDNQISLKELITIIGISKVTYYKRMKKYAHLVQKPNKPKIGKKMNEEVYTQIMENYTQNGQSIRSQLRELNISPKTFYKYRKLHTTQQ